MGRKNSTIAGVAILMLAIAGCSSEETPQASNPSPAANLPPTTKSAIKSPTATQSFNNPIVPGKQSKVAAATYSPSATLIQPTNATERLVMIAKGRNDPFAEIVQAPTVQGLTTNTAKSIPKLPPLPIAQPPAKKVPVRSGVQSVSLNPPGSNKAKPVSKLALVAKTPKVAPKLLPRLTPVLPPVIPSPKLVSVLPEKPQPELAKSVLVTGVVLIGKQLQAIIQVPNEPTSRYVQAGQRLANGLLIKRIEMNEGSNPVVIVEQYGIEVARMVGDNPANSATPTTNPGANPVSWITPSQHIVAVGAS
ncbi:MULTISPECIES: hypothetical protein [Calothrix]|uniref:Uncharacterized protein n=2 Tax=Calothrix TaxID=1186 RepID=A0ABR8A501_9CYAN|nr:MULTISPECIES: hypothetical protein [Calothrix]MBD2194560.1 hypothetical protein [Calothrix parietina FACHB-288]MBD2223334.1 hypothetical protein [Calothrix anomala FACHB-343]